VQFKTAKDLHTFWAETDTGAFDFLYINPQRYVQAHTKSGYNAFAKDSEAPLVLIIVARKDGPARVEELQGKKLAVPNLISLAAQIPQTFLREKGIDVTLAAINSHDSVYRTVDKRLYPAGTSNLRLFGMLGPVMQAQFRVLWKADPLPPFTFAAHPRVSPKALERMQRAMLEMDGNSEGRAYLPRLMLKPSWRPRIATTTSCVG